MFFRRSFDQRVARYRTIELRSRGENIRIYEKHADAEAQTADYKPADKAEILDEECPLFTVHHFAALFKTFLPVIFRMIDSDINRHRIRISLDDAGDNEKERPETDDESRNKFKHEELLELLEALETVENGCEVHCLAVARLF